MYMYDKFVTYVRKVCSLCTCMLYENYMFVTEPCILEQATGIDDKEPGLDGVTISV